MKTLALCHVLDSQHAKWFAGNVCVQTTESRMRFKSKVLANKQPIGFCHVYSELAYLCSKQRFTDLLMDQRGIQEVRHMKYI